MCFSSSSGAADRAAAHQADLERQRQQRVDDGLSTITQQFSGFDDGFYDKRKKAYLDYANPQYQDQYDQAAKELRYSLARAGLTSSTAAADQQALFDTAAGRQRQAIASQADDLVTQSKGDIASAKQSLTSQLLSSGDNNGLEGIAQARVQQLGAAPAFGPLGTLFANVGQGIGTATSSYNNTNAFNQGLQGAGGATLYGRGTGGGGSARVVS